MLSAERRPRLALMPASSSLEALVLCSHAQERPRPPLLTSRGEQITAPYKARAHLLIRQIVNGAAVPEDEAAGAPFHSHQSAGIVSAADDVVSFLRVFFVLFFFFSTFPSHRNTCSDAPDTHP